MYRAGGLVAAALWHVTALLDHNRLVTIPAPKQSNVIGGIQKGVASLQLAGVNAVAREVLSDRSCVQMSEKREKECEKRRKRQKSARRKAIVHAPGGSTSQVALTKPEQSLRYLPLPDFTYW